MHMVAQVVVYNICFETREIPDFPTAEVPENVVSVDVNDMEIEDKFLADFRQIMNDFEPLVKTTPN